MSTDDLGNRMKAYEQVTRSILLPHSYTLLRVDGRAFHSYLRKAVKPFDSEFQADMCVVATRLCKEIAGAVFAYQQSDEISVLLSDVEPQSQPWFGGVIQKMASVAAGVATASLINRRGGDGLPHFDARVFTLPSAVEVGNYFIWRQRDAVRNSVSMAAQAKFSTGQLHGKGSGEMQEMLFSQHGINWNDYPDSHKRGCVITRHVAEGRVEYTDKRTGEMAVTTAMRTTWETGPAPHFTLAPGFLVEILEVPDDPS